jgi:hypothetical protein
MQCELNTLARHARYMTGTQFGTAIVHAHWFAQQQRSVWCKVLRAVCCVAPAWS